MLYMGEDDDKGTTHETWLVGSGLRHDAPDDDVACEPLIRTITTQQHASRRRENDTDTFAGRLAASEREGMEEDQDAASDSNSPLQSRSRIKEDSAPPHPAAAADVRVSGSGGSAGGSSFGEVDYEHARDESRLQLALALRLAAEASLLVEASEWRRGGSRGGEEDAVPGRRPAAGTLTRASEGRHAGGGKGGRRGADERVQEEDERRPGKKLQPWEREQCIFRFWVSDDRARVWGE